MNLISFLKKRPVIYLIPAVGIILGLIFLIANPDSPGQPENQYNILGSIVLTAAIWLGTEQIVRLLWIRFPWNKAALKHLILEILALLLYPSMVTFILFGAYTLITDDKDWMSNYWSTALVAILITFFITSIHEGIYFYKQWKFNSIKSEKLHKQNLEARFETLKTQINPHFLFNSLNTLMSFIEDNPKASAYLSNLSDFLRYTLKTNKAEVILLREELKIVEHYKVLQTSRFQEGLNLHIDIDEKYYHYSVAQLAVQMLVENAIKHNVISKEKPLHVRIYIQDEYVIVENNIQARQADESTGIGLKNIQERYHFLSNKEVKISEKDNKFEVCLPLLIVDRV
ncbi:MAG: histidine kinase [Bacteroidetes bacterium]|nr:histidine kinase [Bacteroidota bacterium]MBL6962295.1 histidine kinase [Bacteroidota bacterium]